MNDTSKQALQQALEACELTAQVIRKTMEQGVTSVPDLGEKEEAFLLGGLLTAHERRIKHVFRDAKKLLIKVERGDKSPARGRKPS